MPDFHLRHLALLATLTACGGQEPAELDSRDGADLASTSKTDKVDICHITGNGSYQVINVSTSAQPAHLAHGDHLAGTFYLDADGDGDGDPDLTSDCLEASYVENGDDCDDGDDTISTTAEEQCDDGIDQDCDGEIDEDCTVEVEIHVNADNAVWAWVDGDPVVFDFNEPHWYHARSATLELDSGADHAIAFYVEDWGGIAYFAASVRVDGLVVAATGAGEFTSVGEVSATYVNEWPRIADWANTPTSAADSLNLLFSPGLVWGDWMQPGFDDSSWSADSTPCTSPNNWTIAYFAATYINYGDLYADGAEMVWHDFGWGPGLCYSSGDSGTAWRTEISL